MKRNEPGEGGGGVGGSSSWDGRDGGGETCFPSIFFLTLYSILLSCPARRRLGWSFVGKEQEKANRHTGTV